MAESWTKMTAAEVRPGDRVRLVTGTELEVSRIESPFLGRDNLLALIEDTPARWFKQPLPPTAELEVSRPG
jgi:hypothetical protein